MIAFAANLPTIARQMAKEAFEEHFSSRRGVWFLEDLGIVCVYNNNPYAHFPDLRNQETAKLRRRLRRAGISELAYGTYPPMGQEDDGYTYAMLLAASEAQMVTIRNIVRITAYETETMLNLDVALE